MRPTLIITGAYGSGKTECAMALAVESASLRPTTLVDLDFVNPYFRSQDHRAELERLGVRVVSPDPRVAEIDAPALPAEAGEAILRPEGQTIVDLGGDPAGAVVIAQYAPALRDYDLWAIVNFSRPTTPEPAEAAALLAEIAAATRLRLTGLVSNTHLGAYTTAEDTLAGLAQARMLAERLAVPVVLACVTAGTVLPPLSVSVLQIAPRLRKPWER